MKISICMPVMRRPSMLVQALHSILMQDHEDVELVIQDGDPTSPVRSNIYVAGVLQLFGDRLSYSVGYDKGIFPAVNSCLRRATGGILYFMCGDDLLCPGALASVNAVFEADRFGGPLWLYGKTVSADECGVTLGIDGGTVTYDELLRHNRLGQPSVFWNRQMMALAGSFDLRYRHAADYELWLRFWKRREPVYLNQTLGIFRHHDEQSTAVNRSKVQEEAYRISQRHRMFADVIQQARNVLGAQQAYERQSHELADH